MRTVALAAPRLAATAPATARESPPRSAARSFFTYSPVSMATGQAVAQRPSVAQVSSPQ